MSWQPPTPPPPLPRHTIKIALAIGLGLAVLSFTLLGVFIASRPPGSGSLLFGDPLPPVASPIPEAPQSPVANHPLECPTACFTTADVAKMILPDKTFADQGLDFVALHWGVDAVRTAGQMHNTIDAAPWKSSFEKPDECYPISPVSPDSEPVRTTSVSTDPVGQLLHATNSSGTLLDQWVRVFPDSTSAQDFMADLSTTIAKCPTLDTGDTIVAELPLDGLDPSVAAVGSLRYLNGERFYEFDVQRGNVVIRTTAKTFNLLDPSLRTIVSEQAALLATVAP